MMCSNTPADNSNTTIAPLPIEVEVSGRWDGNDGKWSTFMINVGDASESAQGQNFRVLPSTFSAFTMLPIQSDACNGECAERRGVEPYNLTQPLGFSADLTQCWNSNGQYKLPLPTWWSGGVIGGALYQGVVGLGPTSKQSTMLGGQWVMGNPSEDLFMGSFGLASGSLAPGKDASTTFLQTLGDSDIVPSLSYGYTAGASYKNDDGVFGSLVLGGYDESRILSKSPNVTIHMENNTLRVGVQSIRYITDPNTQSSSSSFTANSSLFYATIDSTLPYWYMPDTICDRFAEKFKLKYDDKNNLYTIDDAAHNWNVYQNADIEIKLGQTNENTVGAISFSLPYGAFELEGSSPLSNETTRYFSLRKSPKGIYVLGRSFLQETYITVDYEREQFTVAQAAFSDPMPAKHIIPIFSKDYVPPSQNSAPPSGGGGGSGGLSGGAIAGIVIGILAALGLFALGAFFFWKRRHQQRRVEQKVFEIDATSAGEQGKHRRVSELDSPDPPMGSFYGEKGIMPFPPINEMESPPAELYSPPPESLNGLSGSTPTSERDDYFVAGTKMMRRRGATRESTGNNTPGTPIAELSAENDGAISPVIQSAFPIEKAETPVVTPVASPAVLHTRGPSDTSFSTNIDQVIAESNMENEEDKEEQEGTEQRQPIERRPSHARGPSDTTVQSESTAISQPTPEELERWETTKNEPQRPLSQ